MEPLKEILFSMKETLGEIEYGLLQGGPTKKPIEILIYSMEGDLLMLRHKIREAKKKV